MPISSPVSRRYATALVDAATKGGPGAVERVSEEIQRTANTVEASTDLKNLLVNPVFSAVERDRVLTSVMDRLELSDLVRRFVKLLVDQDRITELSAVARAVRRLADERAGRVRAEVQTASALTPDSLEALRRALEARTGKHVEIELNVDPTLLGGVRARIGSIVFDGTLRAQLEQLREGLMHE